MNLQDIQLFYEYNYWATGRILTACAKVSEGQFTRMEEYGPGFSYGSLRGTLVHALDAEQSWRLRFQQKALGPDLVEADFPTLEALQKRWQEDEAAMRGYLAGLNDEALNGLIRYPIDNGGIRERVLWHCLLHVVNHGTQHRAEAAVLLTNYGQSPGDLDFTVFLLERK